MKKLILVLFIITLLSCIFISYADKQPVINNITVSYADSLISVQDNENQYNLVDLNTLPSNFIIELSYASKNNFAGKEFYPKISKAYLLESTAQKLVEANEELFKLGYRIKVYDAYRPYRYQQLLRDAAEKINPATKNYIADPKYGSNHNRGTSVDITLTDLDGQEVAMPTKFDYFGKEASIKYTGCTQEEARNRELLGTIMEKHGFRRINSEWWHFDDTNYLGYPILDIDFEDLK